MPPVRDPDDERALDAVGKVLRQALGGSEQQGSVPSFAEVSLAAFTASSSETGDDKPAASGPSVRELVLFRTLLEQNARIGAMERAFASIAGCVSDASAAALDASRGISALRSDFAADARARALESGVGARVADYGASTGGSSDPDGLRALVGRLSAAEARAAGTLSDLAPADVDSDLHSLHDFLPPAPSEVNALIDGLAAHARRSIIAAGELRSAWAASRRGLLGLAAPVDVERRLLVRSGATAAATEAEERAGDISWASAPARGAAESTESGALSGLLTLGEGHVAAEFAAANSALRARVRTLEIELAAKAMASGALSL
jgi:hypothetical protein